MHDRPAADSSAFDAKAYYEQLITTASLPSLLKRENGLLSEIRELDSERQSLVYNHHHELIAASDTIAAVRSSTRSFDAWHCLLMRGTDEVSRGPPRRGPRPIARSVLRDFTPVDRNHRSRTIAIAGLRYAVLSILSTLPSDVPIDDA